MNSKTSNKIKVESWGRLIEILYDESYQDGLGRYRSNYAFRGLSKKSYPLKTSLIRICGGKDKLESHILKNFSKYANIHDSFNYTLWNWLAIAQHHGLPTRLMDWTYSPFVAMHFATENVERYNEDGVIWCIDFDKAHALLPQPFKEALGGSHVFTIDMLSLMIKELDDLQKFQEEDFLLFFEPPSMDDRIINQFALHSISSRSTTILNKILNKHKDLYKKIIIPKKLKLEIRDKLDQANITERVLFPGLDGLSKWLTRWYSPLKKGK